MQKRRLGSRSAYLFIYKMRIEKTLAYRYDVFSNIMFQCIVMFANAFFWKAIYRGQEMAGGTGVGDMLTYTIISSVMSVLLFTGVEQRVMTGVEQGTIAMDMLKPVSLFSIYFFEDLGAMTSAIVLNGFPILLVGSLCITLPLPKDGIHAFLFGISLVLSFLVNWIFAALFSLLAFVTINMSPLVQVKKHILRLLSGSIIPVWFFPGKFRAVLEFLPFTCIYQLPLSIYIGKIKTGEIVSKMGLQVFWVLVLLTAFALCEKQMRKKVMVQGG